METSSSLLQTQLPVILGILIGIVFILCIIVARNYFALKRVQSKFQSLLAINSNSNLEELLLDHLKERTELIRDLSAATERITTLEKKLAKSKRHVGLVRYDAFPDIGGQQSFALAIYDDNGDGAVVSSIIGRAEAKVYGKPILGGKAERNLTNEEQQAIFEAVSTSPKSFLSQ